MEKKPYIINLSGEDGASISVNLTPEVYETLKDVFDELNSECKYVSVTIEEQVPTSRMYYVEVNRNGKPRKGSRSFVCGCDIPENKNIYDVLNYDPEEICIFQTSDDARAFINSFKKQKK